MREGDAAAGALAIGGVAVVFRVVALAAAVVVLVGAASMVDMMVDMTVDILIVVVLDFVPVAAGVSLLATQ